MSAASWAQGTPWWKLIKPLLDTGLVVMLHVPETIPAHAIRADRRARGHNIAVLRSTTVGLPAGTDPDVRAVAGLLFVTHCPGGGFHFETITAGACVAAYGADVDAVLAALTKEQQHDAMAHLPPLPFQKRPDADEWN